MSSAIGDSNRRADLIEQKAMFKYFLKSEKAEMGGFFAICDVFLCLTEKQ